MFTVAINSSTHQISVALLKGGHGSPNGGKLFAEKSWFSKKDEAEKLLPNIAALLKKAKKHWRDVKEVFVVQGPGPFTGLRVGVTVANALAYSTGSPMIAADVFEYLRTRLPSGFQEKTAIIVKAGGDFFALLTPGMKKETLIDSKKLLTLLKKVSDPRKGVDRNPRMEAKFQYILAEMKPQDSVSIKKIFQTEKVSIKFLNDKELKTFGQAAVVLCKTKKYSSTVKPLYLQKPYITESKKPTFA